MKTKVPVLLHEPEKAVARILRYEAEQPWLSEVAIEAMQRCALRFADQFEIDNPGFNRERFLRACGLA